MMASRNSDVGTARLKDLKCPGLKATAKTALSQSRFAHRDADQARYFCSE